MNRCWSLASSTVVQFIYSPEMLACSEGGVQDRIFGGLQTGGCGAVQSRDCGGVWRGHGEQVTLVTTIVGTTPSLPLVGVRQCTSQCVPLFSMVPLTTLS